jgi:hypothetical protein
MLSAGINVLQAHRIRSLLETIQVSPTIGAPAPLLSGFSVTGVARELPFKAGLPTIVYHFSPTCTWCERNWENIRALDAASQKRFRVVAVTTARNVGPYMAARKLKVDVIEGISENVRSRFGFGGTPHSVVVSSEGVITHDWRGAYTPRIERQIEELFGVALPGISPPPGTR